jgi:hypothetical protein
MQSSTTVKVEHTGLVEMSITVAPVVVNPDMDSNHEYSSPLSPAQYESDYVPAHLQFSRAFSTFFMSSLARKR